MPSSLGLLQCLAFEGEQSSLTNKSLATTSKGHLLLTFIYFPVHRSEVEIETEFDGSLLGRASSQLGTGSAGFWS